MVETTVARKNIRRYRNDLENGIVDGEQRNFLLKLLVEEENNLGVSREQLNELDSQIARLSEVMARQVELIDHLNSLGQPSERPQLILATLNDLMATYITHRQKISAAVLRHC